MNAFRIDYSCISNIVTIESTTIGRLDVFPNWKEIKTKTLYFSHDYNQDRIAHGLARANQLWDTAIAEICNGVWSEMPNVEIHREISSQQLYNENREFLGWERKKVVYKQGLKPKTLIEIK